jgi:hypothetical protein
MDVLTKLSDFLGEQEKEDSIRDKLIAFFKENPNPEDDQVHEFADSLDIEPDELEDEIYALVTSLLKDKAEESTKLEEQDVAPKMSFTAEEAQEIGDALGIDWSDYDVEQFKMGLDIELEHGRRNQLTNLTNDDPMMTGKIALAHLNESVDYYTLLTEMEKQGTKNENPIGKMNEKCDKKKWLKRKAKAT